MADQGTQAADQKTEPTKREGEDLNLAVIAKLYADEEAAWLFLERVRWPNGPVCPHCGVVDRATFLEPKASSRKTPTGKRSFRRWWKCGDCRQQFSVLVGSIFENSKIPVSKWLIAYHLLCAGKNGVSALELSRVLGIAYSSAWFMAHRIRFAMSRPEGIGAKLTREVEADETYIGGRKHGKRGRGAEGKTPVVALVERNGEVRAQVMPNVTSANLAKALREQVAEQAVLFTDTLNVYETPGQEFAAHETVNHGEGEYAKDTPHGRAHINTAEGYFSQLKRSIDGTHHHVSAKHLHRFLSEFD
jgi:transposase-like protein